MFQFKPTEKTYTDPVAAVFLPGRPFGYKYSHGDICLLHDGFESSKIFLNSKVLREAILNSKEYLEEVLNLTIKDKEAVTKVALDDVIEVDKITEDTSKAEIAKATKAKKKTK